MEKTIERLVNGNIKVTIPIRLKYDGCKTVIRQAESESTELDPETMSPLQKAVIQGFQYRDMLESGKVATVSELATEYGLERRHLLFFMDIGSREVRCGGGGRLQHEPLQHRRLVL